MEYDNKLKGYLPIASLRFRSALSLRRIKTVFYRGRSLRLRSKRHQALQNKGFVKLDALCLPPLDIKSQLSQGGRKRNIKN